MFRSTDLADVTFDPGLLDALAHVYAEAAVRELLSQKPVESKDSWASGAEVPTSSARPSEGSNCL